MQGARAVAVVAMALALGCGQTVSDRVAGTEVGGGGGAGGSGGSASGGSGGSPSGGSGGVPVPSCEDAILNGAETDIDCGGPDCPPCIDPDPDPIFGDLCDCDSGGGILVEIDGRPLLMNTAFPEQLDHGPGYTARGAECRPERAHAVIDYCALFPGTVAGCSDANPTATCIMFHTAPIDALPFGTFRDESGQDWALQDGVFSWAGVQRLGDGRWLLGEFAFRLEDGRELEGRVEICTVLEVGCLE